MQLNYDFKTLPMEKILRLHNVEENKSKLQNKELPYKQIKKIRNKQKQIGKRICKFNC